MSARTAGTDLTHPVFTVARGLARLAATYHRASLLDAHHLPKGPALLVGNHGLLGWDAVAFFYLLNLHTGRVPVGLADRKLFGGRPVRGLLDRVGGVPGTRENALDALAGGRLVVCYPGGSRETFKAPAERYRLAWDSTDGFARLACETGTPIVPFAGLGVDDTFFNLGHAPLTRKIFGRYAMPLAVGLGPLPLPVQLRFRCAPPIAPAAARNDPARLKRLVQGAVEAMMEGHGEPARVSVASVP